MPLVRRRRHLDERLEITAEVRLVSGQMLGTQSVEIKGSGAYVSLEYVTGTLGGRRGTFILQHNGTMRGNVPTLIVTVVPDSGTDQLKGLAGKMTIVIAGGTHSYDLEYTLEDVEKQE